MCVSVQFDERTMRVVKVRLDSLDNGVYKSLTLSDDVSVDCVVVRVHVLSRLRVRMSSHNSLRKYN
jgi:hypothetical protein